jgi:AcrR family transcriptional regulator
MDKREILRLSNMESNKLTRECIESALIILMSEKEYSKITISELVSKAGVSRTAYYRNYASKEDILKTFLRDIISDVTTAMEQFSYVTELEPYWRTLFSTMKNHTKTFNVLINAGLGNVILEEITSHMVSSADCKDIKTKYEMIFWSGAIYNILTNWSKNDLNLTENEMVETCLYIIENFNK